MKKDYTTKIFEDSNREEWEEVIEKDLKGKPFDSIITRTINKLQIEPFYTVDNIPEISFNLQNPLQQDIPELGSRSWINYAEVQVNDLSEANGNALSKLEMGADGIIFNLRQPEAVNWNILLKNIQLEYCAMALKAGENEIDLAESLVSYLEEQDYNQEKLNIQLCFDLFENQVQKGKVEKKQLFAIQKQLFSICSNFKGLKCLHINLAKFHNKGAKAVSELALGISQVAVLIETLIESGLDIEKLFDQLSIEIGVGSGYFQQIAKIKALRALLKTLATAHNCEMNSEPFILATTSLRNKTFLDLDVNILRNTSECFAAILGGVSAVYVKPHDFRLHNPKASFERIALNTSLLLREEAHLNKVVDPTQGAYFLENLIEQSYKKAWDLFLQLNEKGDFFKLWDEGEVQNLLKEDEQDERQSINNRKIVKIGANKYPNFTDKIDYSTLEFNTAPDFSDFEVVYALADVENLRLKVEQWAENKKDGKRPKACILATGTDAVTKAKSSFTTNFLGIAGIQIADEIIVKSPESLLKEIERVDSEIIVLCYKEFQSEYNKVWKDNSKIVLIAGKESNEQQWIDEGLYACIHRDIPALAFLSNFVENLTSK